MLRFERERGASKPGVRKEDDVSADDGHKELKERKIARASPLAAAVLKREQKTGEQASRPASQ
jgi:hypothetical protein